MVVRNSMAYSQTLQKKTLVARASCSTTSAQTTYGGPVAGGGSEPQGPHTPRLTVRQRHGKLFDEFDFSRLDSWAP